MKLRIFAGALLLVLAACQSAPEEEIVIPTLAVLPTQGEDSAVAEATVSVTADAAVEATEEPTARLTWTPTMTFTPPPSSTPLPTRTPDLTRAAVGTATAAAIEAPILSTLTPTPTGEGGQNGSATAADEGEGTPVAAVPEVAADLVITEPQFQQQLDLLLQDIPEVERAVVNFVPGALEIRLTASGGEALVTGLVTIDINVSEGFATFSPGEIETGGVDVPDEYVDVVYGDFFLAIARTLDEIRIQRVGEESRFADLTITDSQILITLLVPES